MLAFSLGGSFFSLSQTRAYGIHKHIWAFHFAGVLSSNIHAVDLIQGEKKTMTSRKCIPL